MEWRTYMKTFFESHARLRDEDDDLIWGITQKGNYTPKDGYSIIHVGHKPEFLESWWSNF